MAEDYTDLLKLGLRPIHGIEAAEITLGMTYINIWMGCIPPCLIRPQYLDLSPLLFTIYVMPLREVMH